jgi:tetratricopeptide (TPR) repeat protein
MTEQEKRDRKPPPGRGTASPGYRLWVFFGPWALSLALAGYGVAGLHRTAALMEKRFDAAEAGMKNAFEAQAEYIRLEGTLRAAETRAAAAALKEAVAAGTGRIVRSIDAADRHVGRVERVYADLLEEQKKKTLESLYNEEGLLARIGEAEALFREGKYRQAHELYLSAAESQPENQELIFYRYYALFLLNKNDRSQYRSIREGMTGLERTGYSRPEIGEVLSYIAGEETY